MKVSVEKLPTTSEAVVEVDFSWEDLEKASEKAYRKLVQKVDVQGFRRGKAPRSILERKLGKEYIYQEGLDELMTEAYRQALKENELIPLSQPEVDAPLFEVGHPYHFSIRVPILLPVELGDYHALHVDREEAIITSEEVEQELESRRQREVQWNEVERPAQILDRVTMDLKLTVEDQTISDLKENPFELTDERHGLFSGMDEHIVGMTVGEGKSFTTTIPADYTNEKLAGKEANYTVKLLKVETREVPELDDAFAEKISKGEFQTLEDLRKSISDSLLETKKRRIRDELREKVLGAVTDQASIHLHPVLVKEEAEEMLHQLSHILEQQHMSVDQYLMMMRKSREEYLKELEPDAEKRVKQQLVLDAVVKQEDIQVDPAEIESLFRFYAQIGQALPQSEGQITALTNSLRREKAVTRLIEIIAGPDPDAEDESDEEELAEAGAAVAAAEGASLTDENTVADELVVDADPAPQHDASDEVSSTDATADAPLASEAETASNTADR